MEMSRPIPPGRDWPRIAQGEVWLVGAGPGDPGLMTLHALNALAQAEVVLHDALIDPRILAWAPREAAIEPWAKRGGRAGPSQAALNARMIALARAGRRVVRLKGGDPFVFGRGAEEATALAEAGVPFRVVPGVTAGIGGLAAAGVPVTHRDHGQAVTFVTGHDRRGGMPEGLDWTAIARGAPVIVLYMAVRTLAQIAPRLIAAGRDPSEPVAIVKNATFGHQRVVETTLDEAPAALVRAGLGAPAIICIGPVVNLRSVLAGAGALDPVTQTETAGTGAAGLGGAIGSRPATEPSPVTARSPSATRAHRR